MKKPGFRAKIEFTLFVFGFSCSVFAQQALQGSLGSINRPSLKIGFNTNGYMPVNFPPGNVGANFTQQAFIDSTAYLNPEILRFPGGTNSNHWDWKTGWYRPGYQPPFPALSIRSEEFKPALAAANATGIYVLNLETSTAAYEMKWLRHMDSMAMNLTMIELGNEHNLSNSAFPLQYMTSTAYAQLAKTYFDSVKVISPNAKVCVVGGNSSQRPNWHSDILAQIPAIEAFAWHAYLNANNTDLKFHVNRALAEAFAGANHYGSLPYRFQQGGFNTLPSGKEIWVTEYNLWETQISSAPVIAGTWTHFLYLAALHQYFLSNPKVTMIINHSLACIDPWHESISRVNHKITANGIAMKLLDDVSKGSLTCQDIIFSGNPSMTYSGTTIPKLTGWKFNHNNGAKGYICNFSNQSFKVTLSTVFANGMTFDEYYADTALVLNGLSNLNKVSGILVDSLLVYPYSFTLINSLPSTGLINAAANNVNDQVLIFPNPGKEKITVEIKNADLNKKYIFTLTNSLGQIIKEIQISAASSVVELPKVTRGIYFYQVGVKNIAISKGKLVIE